MTPKLGGSSPFAYVRMGGGMVHKHEMSMGNCINSYEQGDDKIIMTWFGDTVIVSHLPKCNPN